tara:strand:+ start:6106 stop:6285 length:180 start_codon:yes stop_codon:yes gene_type:complete
MAEEQQSWQAPIKEAPPEVMDVIKEVLRLEKKNLSSARPKGLVNDIVSVIKDKVKNETD